MKLKGLTAPDIIDEICEEKRISPQEAAVLSPQTKRLRMCELALVLCLAFATSLFAAFFVLFFAHKYTDPFSSAPLLIVAIIKDCSVVALLIYVLFRQGRSLAALGFGFEFKDIFRAVGVLVAGTAGMYGFHYAAFLAARALGWSTALPHPARVALTLMPFVVACVAMVTNGFFEELIARAYLMSEVQFWTGKPWIAVFISTLFQASYHLYQGVIAAIAAAGTFLIFSLYYNRTRRIMPIILAHIAYDMTLLFVYYHPR